MSDEKTGELERVKAALGKLGRVRQGKTGHGDLVLSAWASDDALVVCQLTGQGERWTVGVQREGGPTPADGHGPSLRAALDELRMHAATHRALAENMERAITLIGAKGAE